MAARLNTLMRGTEVKRCYLAASREIHHHLLDELAPHTRTKILMNLPVDLTKTNKSDLLQHFQA